MALEEKRKIAVFVPISAIPVFDSLSTDSGSVFFFAYSFPISPRRENMIRHRKPLLSKTNQRGKKTTLNLAGLFLLFYSVDLPQRERNLQPPLGRLY